MLNIDVIFSNVLLIRDFITAVQALQHSPNNAPLKGDLIPASFLKSWNSPLLIIYLILTVSRRSSETEVEQ